MVCTRMWARVAGLATAGLAATLGLQLITMDQPGAAAAGRGTVAVVVTGPSSAATSAAVGAAGGQVTEWLPIVDGVAASVSRSVAAELASKPGLAVVADATLRTSGSDWSASATAAQLSALDPPVSWTSGTGAGVGVALIDTGVADTPGLSHVVRGADLSGEGDGIDRYGHGTFMAGLIAGNGAAGGITGVAPGATVVSVKVAGADGATSLSRVIAGIGWAVVHRDALHIRVMSISLGADMPMTAQHDPLDAAVEAAWASGITVVASAGNAGIARVTSPGDDPWVVTVGAIDTSTGAAVHDAGVPRWSGSGDGKPDLLAPGVSVLSLRVPGSTIDTANPAARVGADGFRGTGTSMATALTAGAAAAVLEAHPFATPDDVKAALESGGATVHGSGVPAVDIASADAAHAQPSWRQHHPVAFDGLGIGLVNTMPWASASWTSASWTSASWTSASWTSASWTSASWTSASWTSASWTSASWTSASWTTIRWG